MFLKSLQNGRGHKDSNTIKWPEVKLMKLTSLSNSKDKMDGLKKNISCTKPVSTDFSNKQVHT